MKPYLEKFCATRHQRGRVRAGSGELSAQSTVHVFPSQCEGSAKVTYEAAACGLPQITTREAGDVVTTVFRESSFRQAMSTRSPRRFNISTIIRKSWNGWAMRRGNGWWKISPGTISARACSTPTNWRCRWSAAAGIFEVLKFDRFGFQAQPCDEYQPVNVLLIQLKRIGDLILTVAGDRGAAEVISRRRRSRSSSPTARASCSRRFPASTTLSSRAGAYPTRPHWFAVAQGKIRLLPRFLRARIARLFSPSSQARGNGSPTTPSGASRCGSSVTTSSCPRRCGSSTRSIITSPCSRRSGCMIASQ